ncbi:MAG TPA: HEAT repeat domain-containing protein [Chitinispirillaceae bacterium]|nr:HEAT repeat domain-containing protein [Chitinispirillaceae bacterium]
MTKSSSRRILLLVLCMVIYSQSDAKTRWSSLHQIPYADFIEGNQFVLDLQGCNIFDSTEGVVFIPHGVFNIGLSEWVNIEAGYAGGFTCGMKARILDKKNSFVPSVALGIHNFFSHKEAHLSDHEADTLKTELYLALAKSLEKIKLRVHFGFQTMADNRDEIFNPFFGLEKYFGSGFYITMETFRLDKRFHFSMFASYRFLKNRMEVFAGIADFGEMLRDRRYSIVSSADKSFTRPSIRLGLRFREQFGLGKAEGLQGLEDRLLHQNKTISQLRKEVDSLKVDKGVPEKKEGLKSDNSVITKENEIKLFVRQKLSELKTAFAKEPFEPQEVKAVREELASKKSQIIPVLHEIALDISEDSRIRSLAISSLGGINDSWVADILIDILGKISMRDLKIETLIALGKLNEVSAVPIIQQFVDDPDETVSFTASEVLQKIKKETGIGLEPVEPVADYIPEQKIGLDGDDYMDKENDDENKEENVIEKKSDNEIYLPVPQNFPQYY